MADSSSSTAVATKDVLAVAGLLKGFTMVKPNTMSFEGSPQVEVLGVKVSAADYSTATGAQLAHDKVQGVRRPPNVRPTST